MRKNGRRAAAGAAVLMVLLVGCGGGDDDGDGAASGTTGSPVGGEGTTVVLKNIQFRPDEVTIAKGETVTWKWQDGSIQHNVVSKSSTDDFKSPLQGKGEYSHTFDQSGTFDYVCTVHPQMKGKVVVG